MNPMDLMGGGGFSGSSSATSSSGPVTQGGFNFSPKASTLPPVAWIALAAVALIFLIRRK
jgi:MYXO-CTERM domain-containing protein